jgi:hypothetical protein
MGIIEHLCPPLLKRLKQKLSVSVPISAALLGWLPRKKRPQPKTLVMGSLFVVAVMADRSWVAPTP